MAVGAVVIILRLTSAWPAFAAAVAVVGVCADDGFTGFA